MLEKCPRCEYEWRAKVLTPKSCPRCKTRLDYYIAIEKVKEKFKWRNK